MYQYLNNALNSMPWLSGFLAACGLLILVVFLLLLSKQYQPGGQLFTAYCRAKQLLRRRLLWPLLLVGGAFLYPAQVAWQTNSAANEAAAAAATEALAKPGAGPADVLEAAHQAATIVRAQVVSPTYLLSKMSVALGVFVLLMFLAWGALQAVMPVLPDWAVGDYKKPDRMAAVGLAEPVRGFKGTFLLEISPLARICLFLAFFTVLVLAAGLAVWAAFTIQ